CHRHHAWAVVERPLGARSQLEGGSQRGEEAQCRRDDDNTRASNPIDPERMDGMNSHVSSILLGVNDMERSKRFYMEGLGWKVQNDYKISVFFVPHGGSMVGFYRRDGLADMVGVSPDGSGLRVVLFPLLPGSDE